MKFEYLVRILPAHEDQLSKVLNQLGDDGWELISMTGLGKGVFKRSKRRGAKTMEE